MVAILSYSGQISSLNVVQFSSREKFNFLVFSNKVFFHNKILDVKQNKEDPDSILFSTYLKTYQAKFSEIKPRTKTSLKTLEKLQKELPGFNAEQTDGLADGIDYKTQSMPIIVEQYAYAFKAVNQEDSNQYLKWILERETRLHGKDYKTKLMEINMKEAKLGHFFDPDSPNFVYIFQFENCPFYLGFTYSGFVQMELATLGRLLVGDGSDLDGSELAELEGDAEKRFELIGEKIDQTLGIGLDSEAGNEEEEEDQAEVEGKVEDAEENPSKQ